MLVPNAVRKSVVFLCVKKGGRLKPIGTAFIVSTIQDQHRFVHLVTAEHVIANRDEVFVRANSAVGDIREYPIKYEDWWHHLDPSVQTDMVVLPTGIDRGEVEYSHIPDKSFITDDIIEKFSIGVGDEIFTVGLFRNHFGAGKNLPIVRTGNIALMPEEPVFTDYAGYIEAYLVEARSIGGLSGSPVWVHMPPIRVIKGEVTQYEGQQYYLLGVMHGRFNVKVEDEDVVNESDSQRDDRINSGIGIVVPAKLIYETINQPDLVQQRREIVMRLRKDKDAAEPLAVSEAPEPPTKADNPQHKEDFNRLLTSVATGKQPDD